MGAASNAITTGIGGLVALFASAGVWAQDVQTPARVPDCPSFPTMTYDESNHYLANPDCRTGILAPVQLIPLDGSKESYYLSFGVWIRERGEYESNPNWSHSTPGNVYQMQRYFFHADLHLGER